MYKTFRSLLLTSAILTGSLSQISAIDSEDFQRGICIEGTRPLETCHVNDLKSLGASHVSLNPFGWMNHASDPNLRFSKERGNDSNRRYWGESNDGLIWYANKAHEGGLEVMLRPHIWIRNNKDPETGEFAWLDKIDFESQEDKETFGQKYRDYALHFASIAEEGNMEWYSIGAETLQLSTKYPDYWRQLIKDVRDVYSGKLIYSANWYEEVERIEFWDDLDAIGVQAYFPLTYDEHEGSTITHEELIAGWQPHLDNLQRVSEKFDKPVIFTEIGYKATDCAAITPWEWRGTGETNLEFQKKCYEATFNALKNEDYIEGMYWWKYHVYECENIESVPDRRVRDFTFQNKPAEEAIKEYYGQ